MLKKKRLAVIPILLLCIVLVLVAMTLPGYGQSTTGKVTLRLGHDLAANSYYDQQMQRFAKLVAAKVGDEVEIVIFAGGALGKGPEMTEDVMAGTLDLQLSAPAHLSAIWPKVGGLDLPFVLDTWDRGLAIVTGRPGAYLSEGLKREAGVHVLGWVPLGRRVVISKTPVKSLADFKGLKIRVAASEVYVKTMKALGAVPNNIAWVELYQALQTGATDAGEGPPDILYASKFFEVAKHVTKSWHFATYGTIIMNEKKFNSLSKKAQPALIDAAKTIQLETHAAKASQEAEGLNKLSQAGCTIHDIDVAQLQKAVSGVWDNFAAKYNTGDLIQQIKQIQ